MKQLTKVSKITLKKLHSSEINQKESTTNIPTTAQKISTEKYKSLTKIDTGRGKITKLFNLPTNFENKSKTNH